MKQWLWIALIVTLTSGLVACSNSDHHGVALSSITVEPASSTINVQRAQQYKATGTYSDNSTADITSDVAWTSSDQCVATIDAGGKATSMEEGLTTIKASLAGVEGSTTLTASFLRVTPHEATIRAGGALQYTATEFSRDPAKQDITKQVTWSSSDRSIATIDENGLATGIAITDNPAFITATTSDGRTGYAFLKVGEAGAPDNGLIGSIAFSSLWNYKNRAYVVEYDLWALGVKWSTGYMCILPSEDHQIQRTIASVGEVRVFRKTDATLLLGI